jgi:acetylornithine/succinyldiaminopimelate/putrescine aminotransferase
LAATGQPVKQAAFQPMPPGFWQVPYGDISALEEQAERFEGKLAAILLEVVQGEGGVWPAPPGYLEAVRALCDRTGALLIIDEVQTGLGRTGKWFAFEHFGIRPDIVTMAKALGNGVPIGACWATADAAAAFEPGDHATTYGGQPLAARAALTTVQIMQRENVPEKAARAGARLTSGLQATPGVSDVRGLGLLLAAELVQGLDSKVVAAACLERGLVVNAVTPTALRFEPSLLVSDDEIDEALTIVGKALS